jgi:hypothetical protein
VACGQASAQGERRLHPMTRPAQLKIDGTEVPHDEVVGEDSKSRMVRRPEGMIAGQHHVPRPYFAEALMKALDTAGVAPGDAFYVSRVPPRPRTPGGDFDTGFVNVTPTAASLKEASTAYKEALRRVTVKRAPKGYPIKGCRHEVLKRIVASGSVGVHRSWLALQMIRANPGKGTASMALDCDRRVRELIEAGFIEPTDEGRLVATAKGRRET